MNIWLEPHLGCPKPQSLQGQLARVWGKPLSSTQVESNLYFTLMTLMETDKNNSLKRYILEENFNLKKAKEKLNSA